MRSAGATGHGHPRFQLSRASLCQLLPRAPGSPRHMSALSQALIRSGGQAWGSESCLPSRIYHVTWPWASFFPLGDSVFRWIKPGWGLFDSDWTRGLQVSFLAEHSDILRLTSDTVPHLGRGGQKLPIPPCLRAAPHPGFPEWRVSLREVPHLVYKCLWVWRLHV